MRFRKLFCGAGVFLLLLVTFSSLGLACDDEKRMEVFVQAPIQTVDCTNTPATIGVLGLTIDVSNASFSPKRHGTAPKCADLAVGQTVEVALTSDITDTAGRFTAAEVEVRGNRNNGVKINAPLQAVDTSGTTVSVLGLTVDISSATLLNDKKRPIAASQLKADQFARITIDPDKETLTATKVLVRINQVSIQAPLDEVSCDSSPATITMLGLKIDVTKAVFGPRWHHNGVACSSLEKGDVVTAYLTSDISESATGLLTATQVDLRGGGWWDRSATGRGCGDGSIVMINAPLQTIDVTGSAVTVLGLAIDVKNAWLFNEEFETITLSQLKTGQFAKLTLKPDSLTALTLLAHVDEVKVKAPVTKLDCDNGTITVLGLSIDVTHATFGSKWDWRWGNGKHSWYHKKFKCENLEIGQTVTVELTTDTTPTAKEVEVKGGHDEVMVSASLEDISTTAKSVTVLGLTIDMSAATLKDDNGHTITLDQLAVGQFVDIELTSDQTPLLAVSLIARTGTNQLHIKVLDEKGKPVTQGAVKAVVTIRSGKSVSVREVNGSGALILTSVPAGQAKIVVTRVYNGKTSRANLSAAMKSDTNKIITARLRVVK